MHSVGFLNIPFPRLCVWFLQSTPDNLNLQGKLKKLRVIGSQNGAGENFMVRLFQGGVHFLP